MNITIENILLVGSLMLLVSIILAKRAFKYGVPTLLLFLVIGMLAGSEGIGGIHFDDPKLARFIGVVSFNFIMFSGGLDTDWERVKPILKEGLSLSTIGVLLTALFLGTFIWLVTNFTIYESLLLGSIVSSTDAAAVFSILRSKNLALKSNLRSTLEFESGSNDPMAYVLTIAFLNLVIHQDLGLVSMVPIFLQQMIIGAIAGFAFGYMSTFFINRINLDFEGLYPILVIALMFLTFSATDFVGGNGFLAIYICAVYLGNQNLIHKQTILKMFDGLAWLMQIILFLTLGLLVFPSEIMEVAAIGLLISMALIFLARPFAVFLSLSFFRMPIKRRIYISWVGLRGAVPIVFATYPLLAGISQASMMFNIVFFISVTSVLLQGTTLSLVAKWLDIALPEETKEPQEDERDALDLPMSKMKLVPILPQCPAVGQRIVDLDFPKTAFITMIKRDGQYIRPKGITIIEEHDTLVILVESEGNMKDVDIALGINT
ncbi:MAG: potassium/proton antiporter [Alphaproteobacteria bacterium]